MQELSYVVDRNLKADSDGNTALHHLARVCAAPSRAEHIQLFKQFVTLGISINAKNKVGETPLFVFVSSEKHHNCERHPSHRDQFSIFTEARADFMARNKDMETLLHVVAKLTNRRSEECVRNIDYFKLLIELGCDPLAEDVNQMTALDVAAAYGNEAILQLFKREPDSKTNHELENEEENLAF